MQGLHLNKHGDGQLDLSFVKRIRAIRNSGSAKQKLKEVHQKSVAFESRSDKPETIYVLSHNFNEEETMKCQKDLAFSSSKKLNQIFLQKRIQT